MVFLSQKQHFSKVHTAWRNRLPSASGQGSRMLRLCQVTHNTVVANKLICVKAVPQNPRWNQEPAKQTECKPLGNSYPDVLPDEVAVEASSASYRCPWPTGEEPRQGEDDGKLFFPTCKIKAEWAELLRLAGKKSVTELKIITPSPKYLSWDCSSQPQGLTFTSEQEGSETVAHRSELPMGLICYFIYFEKLKLLSGRK